MKSTTIVVNLVPDPRVALLKELSDPLRLRVVDRLGHAGPATVSRLSAEFGVPAPQLSNHLRRLREAGLISVRRDGRQAVYQLADPGLERLLPLLDSITGRVVPPPSADQAAAQVPSRTCYEHLGGRIGVALYDALRRNRALEAHPDGTVELGPTGTETLKSVGVDVADVKPLRQRFAFECLDATERAPHLAGALADALAVSLIDRGWVQRKPNSRTITLSAAGRRKLKSALGLELPA
jgi:DNA-binding transcriptional ArsR family regulator